LRPRSVSACWRGRPSRTWRLADNCTALHCTAALQSLALGYGGPSTRGIRRRQQRRVVRLVAERR
jgi:hypothetical protein